MSDETYEKMTVNLLQEARLARVNAAKITGMSETDVVNAALITYNMLVNMHRMGFDKFFANNGKETMEVTLEMATKPGSAQGEFNS